MSPGVGESSPSSSISLAHLERLDPLKADEFTESLRNTFYSDNYRGFVTGLRADETIIFINFLARALDFTRTDHELFRKCLCALRRICSETAQLPSSYYIPPTHLVREGEHPIASGGFSDVWAGTFGQRKVALKCLKMSDGHELWQALCKEVAVWKQLSHPKILPLLGVSRMYSRVCMVAERMAYGNITDYLRDHPKENRLALLSDVAEGLEYMHSFGVVHGDLKGKNILVDDSGCVRLTDFGLNSITTDEFSNASSVNNERGTARWMAPELLCVEGHQVARPSKESDVYALAMVAVEIFTGQVPFPNLSHNAVIFKIVKGERPKEVCGLGLSKIVWEMVKRCWQQKPEQRPDVSVVLDCLKEAARMLDMSATSGTDFCDVPSARQSASNFVKTAETPLSQPNVLSPSKAKPSFFRSLKQALSFGPSPTSPVLPVASSLQNHRQNLRHRLSGYLQDESSTLHHQSTSPHDHPQDEVPCMPTPSPPCTPLGLTFRNILRFLHRLVQR